MKKWIFALLVVVATYAAALHVGVPGTVVVAECEENSCN